MDVVGSIGFEPVVYDANAPYYPTDQEAPRNQPIYLVFRERKTIDTKPITNVKLTQIQKRGCSAPLTITIVGNRGTNALAQP